MYHMWISEVYLHRWSSSSQLVLVIHYCIHQVGTRLDDNNQSNRLHFEAPLERYNGTIAIVGTHNHNKAGIVYSLSPANTSSAYDHNFTLSLSHQCTSLAVTGKMSRAWPPSAQRLSPSRRHCQVTWILQCNHAFKNKGQAEMFKLKQFDGHTISCRILMMQLLSSNACDCYLMKHITASFIQTVPFSDTYVQ